MNRLVADGDIDAGSRLANLLAEIQIEFHRNVAGKLEMLLLIVAHRHMGGAVDKNVRGHQARIGEQAERGVFTILAGIDKSIQICSTNMTANDILNMAVLAACKVG